MNQTKVVFVVSTSNSALGQPCQKILSQEPYVVTTRNKNPLLPYKPEELHLLCPKLTLVIEVLGKYSQTNVLKIILLTFSWHAAEKALSPASLYA